MNVAPNPTPLCYHPIAILKKTSSSGDSFYERQTDDLSDDPEKKHYVLFPRADARRGVGRHRRPDEALHRGGQTGPPRRPADHETFQDLRRGRAQLRGSHQHQRRTRMERGLSGRAVVRINTALTPENLPNTGHSKQRVEDGDLKTTPPREPTGKTVYLAGGEVDKTSVSLPTKTPNADFILLITSTTNAAQYSPAA